MIRPLHLFSAMLGGTAAHLDCDYPAWRARLAATPTLR
jgi:hypothetical protein